MTADTSAIHYLGRTVTRGEFQTDSQAIAEVLASNGVSRGDRVLLVLQNMPQAAMACQATWQLGAVVVPVNAMYKAREIGVIVRDCRPSAAIVLDDIYRDVVAPVLAEYASIPTFTTSAVDYANPIVARRLELRRAPSPNGNDLLHTASRHLPVGSSHFTRRNCPPDDLAALVYTSGTTGPPKGAMVRHRNLTVEVELWRDVYDFRAGDAIMGVAPFFHITGLVADLVVALDCGVPLVQCYRFDPAAALDWIARYRPTCMVAAITAYTALLNQPALTTKIVESLRTCLSGGAPVSPSTVERWRQRTGREIRNCYGLTETTCLATLSPEGRETPVDPTTGALSVGKPVGSTKVEIRSDTGDLVPTGEAGEVVIHGPQVVSGYWEKEDETAAAIQESGLRTGDVGFLDEDGWLYLIDRRKDLIVTSGYKVWPREVEEVLLTHPAVAEAGVVGVTDDYRGEEVIAFVSLRPGTVADSAQLVEFCRARLAVFKSPRRIHVLDELPKTASGKILRRELRHLRVDMDDLAGEEDPLNSDSE